MSLWVWHNGEQFFVVFNYVFANAFTYGLMCHNMIISYFHLPYSHASNSSLHLQSTLVSSFYIDVVLMLIIISVRPISPLNGLLAETGDCLSIKMSSYQYMVSQYKDKTHNRFIFIMEIPIPGKTLLHLDGTQVALFSVVWRHGWFEPISARRGLGKPASRLTSFGELN